MTMRRRRTMITSYNIYVFFELILNNAHID